jgi:hypothetical protein
MLKIPNMKSETEGEGLPMVALKGAQHNLQVRFLDVFCPARMQAA